MSRPILAMVALNDLVLPPANKILGKLKEQWPACPAPGDVEKKDQVISFGLGDEWVCISLVPAPIPWFDLEGPCDAAQGWPDAATAMKDHKAHIIVAAMRGTGDIVSRNILLTRLTAAVAETAAAAGVYWEAGAVVHAPGAFVSRAREIRRDALPVDLWVGFRSGKEEDGSRFLFTEGLVDLGRMEIEVNASSASPQELVSAATAVAAHLLAKGPVLKDGDTIELSAQKRIPIHHATSRWNPPRKVILLKL